MGAEQQTQDHKPSFVRDDWFIRGSSLTIYVLKKTKYENILYWENNLTFYSNNLF